MRLQRFQKPNFGRLSGLAYKQHSRYRGTTLHWILQENVGQSDGSKIRDISGYHHDGAMRDTANPATWVRSRYGYGLHFSNSTADDQAIITDLSASDIITNKGRWTILARFKADAIAVGSLSERIVVMHRTTAQSSGLILTAGSTNQLQLYRHNGSAGNTTNVATISAGVWYDYVVTYDGTTFKPYLDGVALSGVTDGLDNLSTAVKTFQVGAFWNTSNAQVSSPFDGIIEEVRVWNRILSPLEILSLTTHPFIEFEDIRPVWMAVAAGLTIPDDIYAVLLGQTESGGYVGRIDA